MIPHPQESENRALPGLVRTYFFLSTLNATTAPTAAITPTTATTLPTPPALALFGALSFAVPGPALREAAPDDAADAVGGAGEEIAGCCADRSCVGVVGADDAEEV